MNLEHLTNLQQQQKTPFALSPISAEAGDPSAYFLDGQVPTWEAFRQRVEESLKVLQESFQNVPRPYYGSSPEELRSLFHKLPPLSAEGMGTKEAIQLVGQGILPYQLHLHHPHVMAHLHCPPLVTSILAEIWISATNQSMDSWDQAPMATIVEEEVVNWLVGEVGFHSQAQHGQQEQGDGVFTSGGTQSNLMGLLLARDHFAQGRGHVPLAWHGLPPESEKWRILCSEITHFSVKKSLHYLGLGEKCLVPLPVQADKTLSAATVEKALLDLQRRGEWPMALVSTAGTTDFGSIDDLQALGQLCRAQSLWHHVDASYGGGLLLSSRHRSRLKGLELCDSLALDFHKMLFQSISCGVFLVRNKASWDYIKSTNPYLNRQEDEEEGVPNLVNKSLQTTRRFDALKVYLTLQALGKKQLGALIDLSLQTSEEVSQVIRSHPQLELLHAGPLNALTFRFIGKGISRGPNPPQLNLINRQIRDRLFRTGVVALGQTTYQDRVYLKLTLLNPRITLDEVKRVLDIIVREGDILLQN